LTRRRGGGNLPTADDRSGKLAEYRVRWHLWCKLATLRARRIAPLPDLLRRNPWVMRAAIASN
jgi:hypothetical protein